MLTKKFKLKKNEFDNIAFLIFATFIIILIPFIANSDFHQVSHDYIEYSSWYNDLIFLNQESNYSYGFGYEYFASIFKEITGFNYVVFNILIIYISLGLKIAFFSRQRNSSIILITYFVILFPRMEMSAIREAFSIGIALVAILYWNYLATVNRVVLIIASLSIHYASSIIFFSTAIKKTLEKLTSNLKYLSLLLIFCIAVSKFLYSKVIFKYIEIPSRYLAYFNEDEAYLDVFSMPVIFALLAILYIPIKCSKNIIIYRNISLFFIIFSIIFLPINFATGRFLNLGYLFSLFWVYQSDGKFKKLIIIIFLLTTLYIFINFYFYFPKYLAKIYN